MSCEHGTIISIGDILVSEEVVLEHFACDYAACKGVCCIEGESGAPLEEHEPMDLERDWDAYSPLMTPEGLQAVREKGFFELDRVGDLVTPVIGKEGACAFAYSGDDGGALCSIETCHLRGLCEFRKPVSCSLYPIRVTRFKGGGMALNLHRWDICKPAFEKGKKEGIRVYEFLKGPLTENFGPEFFQALDAAAQHLG